MYRRQSQMARRDEYHQRKQEGREWLRAERNRQELAWRSEKIYHYFNAAISRPDFFPELSRTIVGCICSERRGSHTPNNHATQAMMEEVMGLPQRVATLELQLQALELQLQEEKLRRDLVEQYVYVLLVALAQVVSEHRGAPHF